MFFFFCSPRGKRDTEEINKNAFVHLEAAQPSLITMSTEATDKMTNRDLQREMNIDLECTRELLETMTKLYEQSRNEHAEEIQKMKKEMKALQDDANKLLSTAVAAATKPLEEALAKAEHDMSNCALMKRDMNIDLECTRGLLESMTRLYEQSHDEHAQAIQKMKKEMEALKNDADKVLSIALAEATKPLEEALAKSQQECQSLLNQYDQARNQYTDEHQRLRRVLALLLKRYDSKQLPDDISQNNAAGNSALIKRIDCLLAHLSDQNEVKDKLITFLSTQLADAEAVISNLEDEQDILNKRSSLLKSEMASFKNDVESWLW